MRKHTKIGQGCEENYSSARVLHYPPIPPSNLEDFQLSSEDKVHLRKHEHVDYGSITLLFPDPNVGGLQVNMLVHLHYVNQCFAAIQVKKVSGGWIDVPCMPHALLVNLGGLMEQWTSDRYLATVRYIILCRETTVPSVPLHNKTSKQVSQ